MAAAQKDDDDGDNHFRLPFFFLLTVTLYRREVLQRVTINLVEVKVGRAELAFSRFKVVCSLISLLFTIQSAVLRRLDRCFHYSLPILV